MSESPVLRTASDPRGLLYEQLRDYRQRHPDEATTVRLFLDFVESTPNCFLRENLAGHMTGSAFVTDEDHARTLLVHHRKLGFWVQPGGHADGDTDLSAVAEEELIEETRLTSFTREGQSIFDIDRHAIPARGEVPEHYHYDVRYLFCATKSQELIISDESIDLRWFSLRTIVDGDLPRQGVRSDESVVRMARKVQRIQRD